MLLAGLIRNWKRRFHLARSRTVAASVACRTRFDSSSGSVTGRRPAARRAASHLPIPRPARILPWRRIEPSNPQQRLIPRQLRPLPSGAAWWCCPAEAWTVHWTRPTSFLLLNLQADRLQVASLFRPAARAWIYPIYPIVRYIRVILETCKWTYPSYIFITLSISNGQNLKSVTYFPFVKHKKMAVSLAIISYSKKN